MQLSCVAHRRRVCVQPCRTGVLLVCLGALGRRGIELEKKSHFSVLQYGCCVCISLAGVSACPLCAQPTLGRPGGAANHAVTIPAAGRQECQRSTDCSAITQPDS